MVLSYRQQKMRRFFMFLFQCDTLLECVQLRCLTLQRFIQRCLEVYIPKYSSLGFLCVAPYT